MKRLTLLCASALLAPLCAAAGGIGMAPTVQIRQVVFFVSKPLGADAGKPTFGLRLDEMLALPGMTEAASAVVQRRWLVNFEVTPLAGAHLDIGSQLRWDLRTRRFGSSAEK